MQLKFSAVMESSGGLTIPTDGMGGSWIVKLPSSRFPAVPENEYAMLGLARAVGIDVPRNRLIDMASVQGLPEDAGRMEGKALAVQRFDRAPGGERIHMEDFAQEFCGLRRGKHQPTSSCGDWSFPYLSATLTCISKTGRCSTPIAAHRFCLRLMILCQRCLTFPTTSLP